MGWDKFRFARVSVDLTFKAKQRLERFCRILKASQAAYIRAALREKMRQDQRASRLRNAKI